ncbi:hypothetical protein HYH02_007504 [Chlamydomonas schloesseri]|uniref:Uncharacterized protein n=1 Tax=Chlamydomonas schloesseri TaxID=2026947 RepID=A0A835WHM1_9CHLO|nr:hypothetical protein HYH02_007504 [Chlamydomonas schloesseri]|eukprot:KAG2447581.1 hypothetical protein HYH02_007504 [Chlamydomonas schloesseri]
MLLVARRRRRRALVVGAAVGAAAANRRRGGGGGGSESYSSSDDEHRTAPPASHGGLPPPPAGYPPAYTAAPPPQAPAGYPTAAAAANPYAYAVPAASLANQKHAAIAGRLRGTPGLIEDASTRELFVPVGNVPGLLYMGVHCHDGGINVSAVTTRPDAQLYLDFIVAGKPESKVARQHSGEGMLRARGQLRAFDEVQVENLAYDADFNSITLYVFDRTTVSQTNAGAVVAEHGWRGALDFKEAAQKLTNIEVDQQEEDIYLSIPGGETMLVVDWEKGQVNIKLGVLAVPSTYTKGFDLSIKGKSVKKASRMFSPPQAKANGRLQIARLFELDNLPAGTAFNEIEVHTFDISNMRSHGVQPTLRVMAPPQ